MSDFKELFGTLHRSRNDLEVLRALLAAPRTKNKQAVSDAISAITDALHRNRVGYAMSAARALLVLVGPAKAILRMKRDGILRASSYEFYENGIAKIIDDWVQNAGAFGISDADVGYLKSTANLLTLAPTLRTLYLSLLSRLRAGRLLVLKSLLAEIDVAFTFPVIEPIPIEQHETMPFSNEELAEGFSYLLGLFYRHFGLAPAHFGLTDPDSGYDQRYRDLLIDGAKVCRYREAEVLLEGFPYHAEPDGNEIRIFSIDPTVERSIRLGFIQAELQAEADRFRLNAERTTGKAASLPEFAKAYFAEYGNQVAKLNPWPVPRYRMEVPMSPPMMSLFADDIAFIEEAWSMEVLAWEEYIPPAEVPGAMIDGSITVRDVLKVQRLLGFLHFGLEQAVAKHVPGSEQAGLYMSSCLPVFQRDSLVKMLAIAVGEQKAADMMALLIADPASPNLDIQYAPVIVAGDYAMVSLAVLSRSNLVRNLLCRLRRRLGPVGKGDRMQLALANALRSAGFAVEEEVNMTSGINKLEVDLLAYRDGVLVAFECKNAYSPCNVYEMRNTYDAVKHAADQLALRQVWLSNSVNQRALFEKLGWLLPPKLDMHTCIALGNRVFNGYECEGHPVRQVHEMLNVLQRDYIEFEDGRVRVWQQEVFLPSDLVAYLQGSTIHADMVGALSPFDNVTALGKMRLIQPSYVLDLLQFKEAVLARYPVRP